MRMVVTLATAVLLATAACSDSGTSATTTTAAADLPATTAAPPTTGAAPTTATTEPAATTTSAAPATSAPAASTTSAATTSSAPATTTTVAPTTTAPTAAFTITAVVFGENGFVEITNVGAAAGDVGGHWLCQRPGYFEIPAQTLEPGESVWVATGTAASAAGATAVAVFGAEGRLGQFSPRTGEVALYDGSTFSNPDLIRSFVEWGPEDGLPRAGRGATAVEAGIWVEGEFVVVSDGAIGITATTPPTDGPDDWIADIGG